MDHSTQGRAADRRSRPDLRRRFETEYRELSEQVRAAYGAALPQRADDVILRVVRLKLRLDV